MSDRIAQIRKEACWRCRNDVTWLLTQLLEARAEHAWANGEARREIDRLSAEVETLKKE